MASIEIITNTWPVQNVLSHLLADRNSKKNIIFATDSYADFGIGFGAKDQITEQVLSVTGRCIIQPRVLKGAEEQQLRTRRKAEVFTPAWVCCLMNSHIDEVWFGRPDVFGRLDGQTWLPEKQPVQMPERKQWQNYIDSRRLEITCGEAPYLASRYDMATGEMIPIKDRIGILDRKLRIVNENAVGEKEWLKWILRAFQAVYGYEYQGDNLLLARINLLLTYIDYMQERWNRNPTQSELEEVAKIISWNLWQMDGLKGSIPLGALYEQYKQLTIFDIFSTDQNTEQSELQEHIPCHVYDWRGRSKVEFNAFRERRQGSMKFDFIIGNPPYQDEVQTQGDRANPVYDKFMDASYEIADCIELIHPARFLFEAGQTPKAWNRKMLSDSHLKVLKYWNDSASVFSNVDIKGGVAITIRDANKDYGAIGTFTSYEQLNDIIQKVAQVEKDAPRLNSLIASQGLYRFSDRFFEEHPDAVNVMGKGTGSKIVSSVMEKLPAVFLDTPGIDGQYVKFLGRMKGQRAYKYIKLDYLVDNEFIHKYNLFIPEANNTGMYGETLTEPTIGHKLEGSSDTFLSAGPFDTVTEAENLARYMKTRFFRALLGIKKVTQHCPPPVWAMIPLQNFTMASDIDWSQSIAGIDRQLYAKYGLSDDEINFIETHVKEME